MSNKDIIGQCIITYESVERVSKSLDQLSEGLATLNFLKALRAFPDLFVGILTYTNNITTQDVIDTIYMREPVDDILMYHLKRYLCELSEDGKYVAKINITFIVLDYYYCFIIVFSVIVIIFLSFSPSLFLSPPSPLSHYQFIIINNLIMYYE